MHGEDARLRQFISSSDSAAAAETEAGGSYMGGAEDGWNDEKKRE